MTRKSAGSRRLARRPQKAARSTRPDPDPFLEEQGGDQEAGEDEEEVDPEVAPLRPADLEVVGHDPDDRDAAEPVEGGQVAPGDGGRRGGRARAFVDQRGVGHTRSRRHTPAAADAAGDRPEEEVGAAREEGGQSSPAVRSRAMRGLRPPTGRGRLAAA